MCIRDSFYGLSSHENVEIKLYNKANPLKPWKMMGRMHDKYLIADGKRYILGGRNTYNYFLGDFPGHKNLSLIHISFFRTQEEFEWREI